MIVLDASAVLALLFREPGHEEVAARIRGSCLSTVNLSEVLSPDRARTQLDIGVNVQVIR